MAENSGVLGAYDKSLDFILNAGLPLALAGTFILCFIAGGAPVAAGALGPAGFLPTASGSFDLVGMFAQAGQGAVNIGHAVPHIAGGGITGFQEGNFFGGLGDALMTPMSELR